MIKKSDKNKEAWTTLNEFISLWFRLCSNGDSAFNWFWEKRRV
ncbi:putative transposase [Acinetobacter baumannii 1593273]